MIFVGWKEEIYVIVGNTGVGYIGKNGFRFETTKEAANARISPDELVLIAMKTALFKKHGFTAAFCDYIFV